MKTYELILILSSPLIMWAAGYLIVKLISIYFNSKERNGNS